MYIDAHYIANYGCKKSKIRMHEFEYKFDYKTVGGKIGHLLASIQGHNIIRENERYVCRNCGKVEHINK